MTDLAAADAMLAEMMARAHRFGMGFADEAERAADPDRMLEFFHLFDRCAFAVRVSIALRLRIRREPAAEARRERERDAPVRDRPQNERPDRERPDCERLDADREREREPASLPILLKTLQGVVDDASALPGLQPAELPALRDLLARAPQPARARPLRHRLAASGAAAIRLPPLGESGPMREARVADGGSVISADGDFPHRRLPRMESGVRAAFPRKRGKARSLSP